MDTTPERTTPVDTEKGTGTNVHLIHDPNPDLTDPSGDGTHTIVKSVHLNVPQGHIGFVREDSDRPAYFVDDGDGNLRLWMGTSLTFTPTLARDLANALNAWADMRQRPEDEEDATDGR